NGLSGQQAAGVLHLSRATLYRWERRVKAEGLRGLEERSRRPKHYRRPQWSPELAEAVQVYREQYGWDKEKLAVLLKQEGWQTSASTVGRIMKRLKARGVLREPLRNGIRTYKRSVKRPYATRKPKDYTVRDPGDLVQVDTLDVRPLPNVVFKQITARDMVSRWDVIEAFRSATARNARAFLDTLQARSPYPVKAIQAVSPRRTGAPGPNGVDGGSEFQAEFEEACREKGIRLFVLPPRSPKLNGHVERAQRTHSEEFHDRYMGELKLKQLNEAMREWEHTYNHIRPHYSLALKTPAQYLADHHQRVAPKAQLSHMS
ncbi:MAG TPA: transposase, partial [Anaerolineae bacterium]|nr:transposase [Anaerolineae bacterium]